MHVWGLHRKEQRLPDPEEEREAGLGRGQWHRGPPPDPLAPGGGAPTAWLGCLPWRAVPSCCLCLVIRRSGTRARPYPHAPSWVGVGGPALQHPEQGLVCSLREAALGVLTEHRPPPQRPGHGSEAPGGFGGGLRLPREGSGWSLCRGPWSPSWAGSPRSQGGPWALARLPGLDPRAATPRGEMGTHF